MKERTNRISKRKTAAVILAILLCGITAGGLLTEVFLLDQCGVNSFGDLTKSRYEDTDGYLNQLYQGVDEVCAYVEQLEMYEQLQAADPELTVDISDAYDEGMEEIFKQALDSAKKDGTGEKQTKNSSRKSGEAASVIVVQDAYEDLSAEYDGNTSSLKNMAGMHYKLSSLLNWGTLKEYSGDQIVVLHNDASDSFYYYWYQDFLQLVREGAIQLTSDYEQSDQAMAEEVLSLLQESVNNGEEMQYDTASGRIFDKKTGSVYTSCWIYQGFSIYENEPPADYPDLLELANQNPKFNGHLEESYYKLKECILYVQELYGNTLAYNPLFEEGDTNYSWLYLKKGSGEDGTEDRVYTNRNVYADVKNYARSAETMEKSDSYVRIGNTLSECESTLSENIEEYYDTMRGRLLDNGDVLMFAVDTAYPIHDSLYRSSRQFEQYHQYMVSVLLVTIVSAVLFVALCVYLAVTAGRSEHDTEIRLHPFDRIKTELAAAVLIVPWMVLSVILFKYIIFYYRYQYEVIAPYAAVTAVYGCLTGAVFLAGLLSLVRRCKAHTLWKNSIICLAVRFIGRVFRNLPVLWKFLLGFLIVAGLHWICIAGAGGLSILLLLLLIVSELAVLVYGIRFLLGYRELKKGIHKLSEGDMQYRIPEEKMKGDLRTEAENLNHISQGLNRAVEESLKNERMKTELITNVSHDIKTPLTSIVNYIDLIKREQPQDPKIVEYLEVLEKKAQQLKRLTEDVVEASKASSGAMKLEMTTLNLLEMIVQTDGEFAEKMEKHHLETVLRLSEEPLLIRADGQKTWRILENLFENAWKYAMPGSRVYVDALRDGEKVVVTVKNVSNHPLNISTEELKARFTRGDVSRNSEGSGLGLSIAESLAALQGGELELVIDGDLFKAILKFPYQKDENCAILSENKTAGV